MAVIITLFLAVFAVTALHATLALSNPSYYKSSIELRQTTLGRNPFDHSWIAEWAALGDSYASGIGAGSRVDRSCSRYDMGYGQLINNDESLGTNPSRKFNYLACAGHTIKNILEGQVNTLSNKQMIITMSAGGNDVGFANVVDGCLSQILDGLDCDSEIQKTKDLIQGADFAQDLDKLIQATRTKLAYPNSRIFWTAYAKLFDTTTKDCDTVTWASLLALGSRVFLTQARRTQLNELVDLLNGKIENAVKRAGPQVVFVKWEDKIVQVRGRFCEPGVDETKKIGDNRETLSFYNWYSTLDDNAIKDNLLKTRQGPKPPADSMGFYQARIVSSIKKTLTEKPQLIDRVQADNPELKNKDVDTIASIWSDTIMRCFHPQRFAHQIIAEAVLEALNFMQARELGLPAAPTTTFGCAPPTGLPSYRGVRGACYRDQPNGDRVSFSVKDADAEINNFCRGHEGEQIGTGDGIKESRPNGSSTRTLVLRASLRTDNKCQGNKDKVHLTTHECRTNLQSAMNECDTDTVDKKLGGTYIAECVEYSIEGSNKPFLSGTQKAPPPPATQNIDLGILTCGSEHRPGDQKYFMTLEEANSAVNEFCNHLHDNPVEFKSGGVPLQARRTGRPEISVSATWKDAKDCPSLNFKDKNAVDLCKKRLSNPINICDTAKNNNNYWKQGGTFFRDCISWSITRAST